MPRKKTLEKAIRHYGSKNQITKSIEEMAELIRALTRDDTQNIMEEIADVHIMITQLRLIFDSQQIDDMITQKLKRLESRIERGNSR